MHIRIISRADHIGRRFYVERENAHFFGLFKTWQDVGSVIGYKTEAEAKRFAEDYAKGSWLSDSAHFNQSN